MNWIANRIALPLLMLALGLLPAAQAGAQDLAYFADTGEVQILNPDPPVYQIVIQGGPFIPGNYSNPPSSSVLGVTSTNISLLFLNPQPAGPVSLGDILPAGLSEPEYLDRITSATSQGTPMGLVYVPEPTSLALLGLGGLALMRRRRGMPA